MIGELKKYIDVNIGPILVNSISTVDYPSFVVIPSNIDIKELCGHYEDTEYVAPKWYQELVNSNYKLIIIDGIDNISKDEQSKFLELLKYRKVSTFDIPVDCCIVVTGKNINSDNINEEIFSLCIYVRG